MKQWIHLPILPVITPAENYDLWISEEDGEPVFVYMPDGFRPDETEKGHHYHIDAVQEALSI